MKSQITLEYLVTIVFAVLFFMFMFFYFSGEISDFTEKRRIESTEDLANSLKIELDTAAVVHNGYSRSIVLPSEISGSNYSVSIRKKELTVKAMEAEYTVFVPEVNGNFTKGINEISRDEDVISIR